MTEWGRINGGFMKLKIHGTFEDGGRGEIIYNQYILSSSQHSLSVGHQTMETRNQITWSARNSLPCKKNSTITVVLDI